MKKQEKLLVDLFEEIYETYDELDGVINSKFTNFFLDKIVGNFQTIKSVAEAIYLNGDANLKLYSSEINDVALFYDFVNKKKLDSNDTYVMVLAVLRNITEDVIIPQAEVVLEGKKEMITDEEVIYYTVATDSETRAKGFQALTLFYYISSLFEKDQHFMGIDFEFNSKKIALMQINFEGHKREKDKPIKSFIYIIYPPQFEDKFSNFLIKYILENKKIIRILHGSDSLDIPYVYYELLNSNKQSVINFTKTLADTRYLCEYYNIEQDVENKKCKIYLALKNFGIISQKHFDQLLKNEKEMGPIYDIFIEIHNLSKPLLLYTLYDVIFLKQFYLTFAKMGDIYQEIIPEFTRLVFLEKREITDVIRAVTVQTNSMNNYMITGDDGTSKHRLIDIFNLIIPDIKIELIPIENLLQINYFRANFTTLFKYIVYYLLSKKYVIYVNKRDIMKTELSLKSIYTKLYQLGYKNSALLVNQFKEQAKTKIWFLHT